MARGLSPESMLSNPSFALVKTKAKWSWELTKYEVWWKGKLLGEVWLEKTSSHRKAGRLITKTFHPKRWKYALAGGRTSTEHYTRKSAVLGLLEKYLEGA